MVSVGKNSGRNKSLSFELNLVPFIDVLSTCICFLLITAVFMQLGTVNVKQAIGDAAAASKKEEPALWLKMTESGEIVFTVKNVKASRASQFTLRPTNLGTDWNRFNQSVQVVKQTYPNVATALILPSAQTRYEDVIRIMDNVKKGAIPQVGIAPL